MIVWKYLVNSTTPYFINLKEKLKGEKGVVKKMLSYWEYFATTFDNPTKVVKMIKKCKTFETYDIAVKKIMDIRVLRS